ncbi:unnamed protein product, partial [Coregonus sp. 'balchen']
VDIAMRMDSGDLLDFVEWECYGMPATKNVIMYGCCSDPYPDITYTVLLQRRSSFYIFNLLLPCFLISFLAPLGFYLPADSGKKVSLGVTVLLALTVFQLTVAESMPPSERKYYIATMTMITASTALTIFIMNINFCGAEAKPVSHWAKVLIINYMSKIFFVYETHLFSSKYEGFESNGNRSLGDCCKEAPPCCPEDEKAAVVAAVVASVIFDPCVFCSHGSSLPGVDSKLVWNVEYIANCFWEQRATCAKGS